jgi:hypothetical protein
MPTTLNSLKDRTRTAIAKTDQPLLQNVWQHEIEYHFDVCKATSGEYTKLSQRMKKKKLFELLFTLA